MAVNIAANGKAKRRMARLYGTGTGSLAPLSFYFEYSRSIFVAAKLDHHAEQLGALGHPVRLAILRYVVQAGSGGTAAGAIQTHVDMPASTLSHHLKRLVDAGVIRSRAEGTFHYYSADYEALRKLTDYLWEDCCKNGGGQCC
jgi:DNA-binding transcriptional ArsR family regulator